MSDKPPNPILAQLALLLDNMVQVAQASPFKDLANLDQVQATLADPNHVWKV